MQIKLQNLKDESLFNQNKFILFQNFMLFHLDFYVENIKVKLYY